MTFREKYHEDFPKNCKVNPDILSCPADYEYEERWNCKHDTMTCKECWNRIMKKNEDLNL